MYEINYLNNLHNIAAEDKDRTAIVSDSGRQSVSYEKLDMTSSAVANKIHSMGVKPGDAVTVMMRRNAHSIEAEVGVLKAGAVFVPLMASYPEKRIDYIQNDCNSKLLLDEDFFEDISEYDPEFEAVSPCKDIVMVVYTSGSTGNPKGVVYDLAAYNMTVQRLASQLENINPVIMGAFAPMAFIAHQFEFAAVFDCGGTTHIIPEEIRIDPIALENFYRDNRITAGFVPPKLFKLFKGELPDFRKIVFGGEKITDIDPGNYNIEVSYAQTEAMNISVYTIDGPRKEAIIGTAVSGTQIYLLDENGNDVGIMHEGEICAKGIYPRRYLNLPEETEKTFEETQDGEVLVHTGDIGIRLENGLLQYINRRDFMVKINGNKVDPSEIEQAMKQSPGVVDAVVKAFEDDSGRVFLCCYYVADSTFDLEGTEQSLKNTLPYYMIPAGFVRMESLPKNSNGKIDRQALEKPENLKTKREYLAPANDGERKLCGIVEKVLQVDEVGMNDNLFELGADSLRVSALVGMLEQENMGIIEAKQVYDNPVLSDLMKTISKSHKVGKNDCVLLSKGDDTVIPVIAYPTANMGTDAYRKMVEVLSPKVTVFGFENHNLNYSDIPILSEALLAKYYRLIGINGVENFTIKPADRKFFLGWSFGGSIAFEASLIAQQIGAAQSGAILLDPLLVDKENRKTVIESAADPNLKKYFESEEIFAGSRSSHNVSQILENNRLVARMLADYVPSGRLYSDVLFIKAGVVRDTDLVKSLCYKYPANGYEKYCENIRIVTIDCNHDELGKNEEALKLIKEYILEKSAD